MGAEQLANQVASTLQKFEGKASVNAHLKIQPSGRTVLPPNAARLTYAGLT